MLRQTLYLKFQHLYIFDCYKIIPKQMGNCNFYCDYPDQVLTLAMQRALLRMCFIFDEQSINKINKLVLQRSKDIIQLDNYTAQYQPLNCQQNVQQIEEDSRLIIRPKMPGQGLIVYKWGYYIGQIRDKKADDGNAKMILIDPPRQKGEAEMVKLVIKGEWRKGNLVEGKAYNACNQQLFELRWNNPGRNISLRFSEGHIKSYNGEVELASSENLISTLTGMAAIEFSDGSTYRGTVMEGLMHTEAGKDALFTSAEETYMGQYQKGLRNGPSHILRKTESVEWAFRMDWHQGLPDLSTIQPESEEQVQSRIRESTFF